ncbi:MAG: hypothetical protein U0637_10905 [Phycisphaerales bacterium]
MYRSVAAICAVSALVIPLGSSLADTLPEAPQAPVSETLDDFDGLRGSLSLMCEVVGCYYQRAPETPSVAEEVRGFIAAFDANGVSPLVTDAEREQSRLGVYVCRLWLSNHPNTLDPGLEADLISTLDAVEASL